MLYSLEKNQPVAQFEIGHYKNFVYFIVDWKMKKVGWIDPQSEIKPLLQTLKHFELDLQAILLTHTHFDHIAGLSEILGIFPEIPIYVHEKETHRLNPKLSKQAKIHLIQDNDSIGIGQMNIKVLHTPGHSAGECCYFLETDPPYLFTGDTVFIRDCGRTDLETGDNKALFESLQRIKTLPHNSVILPGHHYRPESSSTLERELRESPPFLCKTIEELAALP